MRIVVNDIAAVPGSGGVFSVLEDFYNEVKKYSKNHKDIEWYFILSGKYVQETDNIKVITMPDIKKSWIKRLSFELLTGRKVINELYPDIYLSLQNTMTLGVSGCKKWAYLHQSLSYENDYKFSLFKKNEIKLWIHQNVIGKVINFTLKHSTTNVIVQTKWMKKRLIEKKILKAKDIIVIPPNNLEIDKNEDIDNIKMCSFFYPATAMIYKNHMLLFEATKILENQGYKLEVICTISPKESKRLKLPNVDSIRLVGRLSRENVLDEYKRSILVFPSLVETFGLPMLEAKMTNDFIIAGNTEYGREVLSSYPNKTFFDPYSVNDLVESMKKCLDGEIKIKKVLNTVKNKETITNVILNGCD